MSLRLRFKFLDSVITPTILFSLLTCPLTSNQLQQLEVVKNRILPSIVGWAPLVDNDWHELMQKMNRKLENAQQIFNVGSWIERLLVGRFRFAAKIASGMISWASITSEQYPYHRWQLNYCVEPRRRIGRPAKCWDDQTQFFAQHRKFSIRHGFRRPSMRHGVLMRNVSRTGIVCVCVLLSCVCFARMLHHGCDEVKRG